MKWIQIIRAAEWWDYKFPPILVACYWILAQSTISIVEGLYTVVFILLALSAGAIYVSLINDLTDIEEDALAGKKNRMAQFSKTTRWALIGIALLPILVFSFLLHNHSMALIFYLLCYVAFTLYSVPPFRFKIRGLLGIIADASGSQLFPTLFVAFYTAQQCHYTFNNSQSFALAIWSLCFGLRGILWHQFHDLQNDIKSGLNTWVQQLKKPEIKRLALTLITAEILAFLMLVESFELKGVYVALVVYLIYLLLHLKLNSPEVIILKYSRSNYTILLNEFYQVFLPLALLISISLIQTNGYYLLILHLCLFPFGYYRIFKTLHLLNFIKR